MTQNNRVIVVGGGHNGLVAAGYLARAGLPVQILERRKITGGAAVTEEWFPGYRLSTCSYFCHMLQKKVIDDLSLRQHGFHVYSIDPHTFIPFPDGQHISIWHDDHKTAEEVRRISPHDADAWIEWNSFWRRAAGILRDFFLTPPPTLSQLVDKASQIGEEALLQTLLTVPMKDLVERHFESEQIRGAVCSTADHGDMTAPGSALSAAYFRVGHLRDDMENHGIVQGGMGAITQAMGRSAKAHGASIRTDAEVARIVTNGGRAAGVELASGEVLTASVVISNADPKRTFLQMVDRSDLGEEFVAAVRALKTDSASLKFHCALRELPDFSGYLGSEFDPRHLAMCQVSPSLGYVQSSWTDAQEGRPSRTPIMRIQIPSVYDHTLAPEGHHVMSLWVTYEPPHLKEGSWADHRQEVGEHPIDELSKYAPNLRNALIDWDILTPEDIEERIGMTDGNIRHIDIVPQQMLSRRPLPGWSDYRTPIDGLYMCGAGTHPGGEVTGAPGHNAAHAVLEDLELGS